MHFITSNFNHLSSNSEWFFLKKKLNSIIDHKYNNFFWILNNKIYLNKYQTFHILLEVDHFNTNEIEKKINLLKKKFPKNNKNYFFFYLIPQFNNNLDDNNKISNSISAIISTLRKINNFKFYVKIYSNPKNLKTNFRNKILIKFPFEIKAVKFFSNIILSNIKKILSTPYKLIIIDCDNTLWGGILDEDGVNKIQYSEDQEGKIYEIFQKFLKNLKNRGYLLSISSKNNEKKVWNAMRSRKMILQKQDFIYPKINWLDKSLNIQKTLKSLRLRPNDAMFIDDNILEVERVKKNIPSINTLHFDDPDNFFLKLDKDDRFLKKKILKEDKKKNELYKIRSKFEDLRIVENNSYKLIKKIDQKIKFSDCNSGNFNRALQILNKTNQFNFSLNRYNEKKLQHILNKKSVYKVKLVSLKDKFGDYGLIGIFILKTQKYKIEVLDFALSCRVLERFVEDYIIYFILKNFKATNYIINYQSSTYNKDLIPKFLKKNFFTLKNKNNNIYKYEIIKKKGLNEIKKIFNQ